MSNTPRHDLVLIRIHATARNTRPVRFSGVVEAVGADVTGFAPGDTVCGTAERLSGEYVCIPQRYIETIQGEK
jgi:threonine dehydrogenase-like Zn-dependent dehydrogenase